MYSKLLVPLDGSPFAERALTPAVEIARATGAALELLMVHEHVPMLAAEVGVPAGWIADDTADDERLRYLEHLAGRIRERFGVTIGWSLLDGSPDASISEHAQTGGADLIVMATRGLTGLRRELAGSVADSVVRHASVPVLMLRDHDVAASPVSPRAPGDFRRILVLLDGSAAADAIVNAVAPLARCRAPAMVLLRVVAPVLPPTFSVQFVDQVFALVPDTEATRLALQEADAHLDAVATRLRYAGVPRVETRVRVSTRPATVILELAASDGIDLVAMTTHGRGASRLLLGSVADEVLRGTACPLLLYRPRSAASARRRNVLATRP